jgi:hypothetical protein
MQSVSPSTAGPVPRLPAVVDLGEGLTPADIWQSLHAGERRWLLRAPEDERRPLAAFMDASDKQLMEILSSFPARRWAELCNGAGWTPIALAAFSWCQGAGLKDVLLGWERLGEAGALVAGSAAVRAAVFINPVLLPENRLSALLGATSSTIGQRLLLLARGQAPIIDIDPSAQARLDPTIAALIGAAAIRPGGGLDAPGANYRPSERGR